MCSTVLTDSIAKKGYCNVNQIKKPEGIYKMYQVLGLHVSVTSDYVP
jgi:hypothetical protein